MLYTASYATWRPDLGVPVRISRGRPRGWVDGEVLPALIPTAAVAFGIEDDAEARRVYRHQLHRHSHVIDRALFDLGRMYGNHPLVLLCHEADPARCHRRWAAEWLTHRYSIDVPETTEGSPR